MGENVLLNVCLYVKSLHQSLSDVSAMDNETRAGLYEGQQRQKIEWMSHMATVGEGVGRKDECMHASEYVTCAPEGRGITMFRFGPVPELRPTGQMLQCT